MFTGKVPVLAQSIRFKNRKSYDFQGSLSGRNAQS